MANRYDIDDLAQDARSNWLALVAIVTIVVSWGMVAFHLVQ